MFSENHIYTFLLHLQKRLPLPFTYNNEKKFTPFFLSFLVLYKLCIIKIYLCTKDFFLFVFVLLFFFFNLMGCRWVYGVNGG